MISDIQIAFQGPMNLENYDRSLPAALQHPSMPLPFLDCMAVREEVFVKGQNIPLLLEADSDDCRSYHWVAYAHDDDGSPIPVGNLRLVPFPHEAHPLPGSSFDLPESPTSNVLKAQPRQWIVDRPTSFHDGKEPYLKLGRMAVVEAYRGKGIAGKLVRTAIEWATQNSTLFNQPDSEDESVVELDPSLTTWRGLICIHAQEYVADRWASWGFQVDEKMGRWTEAGIPHVGMFLRVKLTQTA
jgi:predicted GNAT family N-acyltransferase